MKVDVNCEYLIKSKDNRKVSLIRIDEETITCYKYSDFLDFSEWITKNDFYNEFEVLEKYEGYYEWRRT